MTEDNMPSADIWPAILEIADKYKLAISSAFLLGIQNYKKNINKSLLITALTNQNMEDVLKIINANPNSFKKLNTTFKKITDEVSTKIISEYSNVLDVKNVSLHKYIDKYVADLVVQINDQTKQVLKNVIREGWDNEILPKQLAKNITEVVGLDKRRMNSLLKYEHDLVMNKTLFNKYPNTPAGKDAWLKEIHKLKMKKYNELLFDRGMTIARTEAINMANEGSRKTYEEMANRNPIIKNEYELLWILTPDDRLCNECRKMKDQRCSFSGNFTYVKTNSEGKEINRSFFKRPTLHPRCRCTIVCVKKL